MKKRQRADEIEFHECFPDGLGDLVVVGWAIKISPINEIFGDEDEGHEDE